MWRKVARAIKALMCDDALNQRRLTRVRRRGGGEGFRTAALNDADEMRRELTRFFPDFHTDPCEAEELLASWADHSFGEWHWEGVA